MQSIFDKIIKRQIPAHIIYEDDQTLAFLDINPVQPGHTLVIPKCQVSRLEDLDTASYNDLMTSVKKIMQRQIAVFGEQYRSCLKVEGFGIDHAHVHVIPCQNASDFAVTPSKSTTPDHANLAKIAEILRF